MGTTERRIIWFFTAGLLLFLSGSIAGHKDIVVTRKVHVSALVHKAAMQSGISHQQPRRTLTVFIHGSSVSARIKARMMPTRPVKRSFKCTEGLNHWSATGPEFSLHKKVSLLLESDPSKFISEDFYLFGWSGKLSFQAREDAARALFPALVDLLENSRDSHGQLPALRIITHSHGGNVALLLAEMAELYQQELTIDELIVLACPVQDRTAYLMQHHMFKKIYSIYSNGDFTQIGDPQGAYRHSQATTFFSRRCFLPRQSLHQVKIKIDGRSLGHTDFTHPPFLPLLSSIINEIDAWYTRSHACRYTRLALDIQKD